MTTTSQSTWSSTSGQNPTLPAGTRIYAVGDIHGRFDLLKSMSNAIERDLEERPVKDPVTIYLGDYVDRGPQSREVIEFLINSQKRTPREIYLKGNHEATLLDFLASPDYLQEWLKHGGTDTLISYGLTQHDLTASADPTLAQGIFKKNLPKTHQEFFNTLSIRYQCGDYLFVHAGLRPGIPIDEQTEHDCIWIKSEFLEYQGDFGAYVVHGHTPWERIDRHHNRLDVDTHAHTSNRLTCAVLEADKMSYIEATPDNWQFFEVIP